MTKVVKEIKSEEISNYILENQRFILYVSSGQNSQIKDFEDEFKNLIQNLDINDDVLYMNLDGVNTGSFYDLLKNNYSSNAKLKNQIVSSDSSLFILPMERL